MRHSVKDLLVWVSNNNDDVRDEFLLAGNHGGAGFHVAAMLQFIDRFHYDEFFAYWQKWQTWPVEERNGGGGCCCGGEGCARTHKAEVHPNGHKEHEFELVIS